MVTMSWLSLQLLIGMLLLQNFVAKHEAMTTSISTNGETETTINPVSQPHDNVTQFNDTSNDLTDGHQNITDTPSNNTVETTTLPGSDLSTPPPVSEHPQTSNVTKTDHSVIVPQATVSGKIETNPTPKKPEEDASPKTYGAAYIIILVIIIVCMIGVTIYCCFQKNTRRYSMDLHPKQEDAQVPLSAIDPEVFDSTSVKDMQTFSPVESSIPLKAPEPVKDAEKPVEGKETTEVKQEQSDTQAIVISEDKAVELTIVDLTDEAVAVSNKTSMESLDEPLNENKNNSNNNNIRDKVNENGHFTEISLDDFCTLG
ncbi:uncharacterized protein [Misgurnus anguillicaudatus]|uniref:uncharacterized protein isoform X1 n=1 Tax=Misgurnus anguillicaudatus TaxID=75329 RepID=UPI003CCF7F0C